MSNQQQNDVNEGLSEKIFAGLDFILKSFQFNLFGNKEPKQVWKSIFTGEVTTSDMDGLLSHAFSNHVKILVALRESARAEMLAMQLLEMSKLVSITTGGLVKLFFIFF